MALEKNRSPREWERQRHDDNPFKDSHHASPALNRTHRAQSVVNAGQAECPTAYRQ
jgi:hypothetical protein